jgi:hypothetical protein
LDKRAGGHTKEYLFIIKFNKLQIIWVLMRQMYARGKRWVEIGSARALQIIQQGPQ